MRLLLALIFALASTEPGAAASVARAVRSPAGSPAAAAPFPGGGLRFGPSRLGPSSFGPALSSNLPWSAEARPASSSSSGPSFRQAAGGAGPVAEIFQASGLAASLSRAYRTLADPAATDEEKRAAVGRAVERMETACAGSCAAAHRVLSNSMEPVLRYLYEETPEAVKESLGISSAELRLRVRRAQDILYDSDPEVLRYRLLALVDLLKYLLSTQEKALFALFAPGEGPEAAAERAGKDLAELFKQGSVVARLIAEVKDSEKRGGIDAEKMRAILADVQFLGFFYVKVAQSLSNTGAAFSPEALEELQVIQDKLPRMPPEQVLQVIREEFGREASEIFEGFDPASPVASASIAQTYRAKIHLRFGRKKEVIVKVQRPGLPARLEQNRKLNGVLLRGWRVFSRPELEPVHAFTADQVRGLEDAFEGELDFPAEGGRMNRFRRLNPFSLVRTPRFFASHSTRRVLTMEALPGANVDRVVKRLRGPPGAPPDPAAVKILSRLFSNLLGTALYQSFIIRELHADLHPGNILADERGRIGLVDWSQVFRTQGLILRPARALWHLVRGNPRGFARALTAMGDEGTADRKRLEEITREAFAAHPRKRIRDFGDDDFSKLARIPADVFRRARAEAGFRLRPGYAQLVRTLLPLSGTLLTLAASLPKSVRNRILLWNALTFIPAGLVRAICARLFFWLI